MKYSARVTPGRIIESLATIIDDLGLSAFAHGVGGLELTTFAWGHFGVFPLVEDRSVRNRSGSTMTSHSSLTTSAPVSTSENSPESLRSRIERRLGRPADAAANAFLEQVVARSGQADEVGLELEEVADQLAAAKDRVAEAER